MMQNERPGSRISQIPTYLSISWARVFLTEPKATTFWTFFTQRMWLYPVLYGSFVYLAEMRRYVYIVSVLLRNLYRLPRLGCEIDLDTTPRNTALSGRMW